MKIHSICLAKNEADIIAQTLSKAAEWNDYIYVVDNNSSDGTWEIIQELAETHPQIVPHKQDARPYFDSMRGEMFYDFRSNSEPGDWWCKLDADEFYIDDPRLFLSGVPNQYQAVWAASFQYYFTDEDLKQYEQEPAAFADDIPVEQKCRYYQNDWSENRFFKYDSRMVWDTQDKVRSWPFFGAIYPERIRLKHFQYRSPQQMKQRISTRLEAAALDREASAFLHETQLLAKSGGSTDKFVDRQTEVDELWKQRIVEAADLSFDRPGNNYAMREDLMPPVPRSFFPPVENRVRYLKKYVNRTTLSKVSFLSKG